MEREPYPSDLADEQWALIEPMITAWKQDRVARSATGDPGSCKDYCANVVNLMNDLVEPIDVAYCALYLASDESRFVTGADYVVDAGASAGKS